MKHNKKSIIKRFRCYTKYRYSCIRTSDIFYKYDQCKQVELKLFKNTKNITEIKYNIFYNIIYITRFHSNFILGLARG